MASRKRLHGGRWRKLYQRPAQPMSVRGAVFSNTQHGTWQRTYAQYVDFQKPMPDIATPVAGQSQSSTEGSRK